MTESLWPEVPRPNHDIPCDHCELIHQSPRLIWGEGSPNASVWILLDNPGAREDREQHSFTCAARETLYEMAHQVGFHADSLYVTYVLRRRPRRAYDKLHERQDCLQNLRREMTIFRPPILFCLGDVALQSFTGDPEQSVKTARQHWWEDCGLTISASYHPLAVRRRPSLRPLAEADWRLCFAHHTKEVVRPSPNH